MIPLLCLLGTVPVAPQRDRWGRGPAAHRVASSVTQRSRTVAALLASPHPPHPAAAAPGVASQASSERGVSVKVTCRSPVFLLKGVKCSSVAFAYAPRGSGCAFCSRCEAGSRFLSVPGASSVCPPRPVEDPRPSFRHRRAFPPLPSAAPPPPSLQRRAGAWRPVVRTRPLLRLPVALRPPSRVSGGRGTSSVATTPLGFVLSSRVEFIQKWKEVTPSKMFIFCNS